MIFLELTGVLLLIRVLFLKVLPWRFLSVSTINLIGVLVFIGLGIEYDRFSEPQKSVAMVAVFYLFLLVGELFGKKSGVNKASLLDFGSRLVKNPGVRVFFFFLFVLYIVYPLLMILVSGGSLIEKGVTTWTQSGEAARTQRLIDRVYNAEGKGALDSVLTQLVGFWYLSVGVVFIRSKRIAYLGLALNIITQLVTSQGGRSGTMLAIGLLLLVWMLTSRRRLFMTFAVLLIVSVSGMFLMDVLLKGRQGLTSQETLSERVENTLRQDFAYGGLGLNFAMNARPATLEVGLNYLSRMAVLPVPRLLWPAKPTLDPNVEMTEAYRGLPFNLIGSVLLFTPLGEGIFYFGFWGLLLIPFLYGLTVSLLEKVYSSSPAFSGLLAQVYLWAFLGMRHTYWNLFSALLVLNFLLIIFLWFGLKGFPKIVRRAVSKERDEILQRRGAS